MAITAILMDFPVIWLSLTVDMPRWYFTSPDPWGGRREEGRREEGGGRREGERREEGGGRREEGGGKEGGGRREGEMGHK